MITVRDLLQYSFDRGLSHIPSALSMLDYLNVLFAEKVVTRDDIIVIGKPFGAQAYYLIWKDIGWIENIHDLSVGVKHDEHKFVEFSEETIGNALGVAAGIAMTTDKRVWVNISDAALQMGNTIEALQFIGHHRLKNIFVTVDYNGDQVTGKTDSILSVEPCIDLCRHYGWWTQVVDGHDHDQLSRGFDNLTTALPNIVFCRTVKGHGVPSMINNRDWHYKRLESQQQLDEIISQ